MSSAMPSRVGRLGSLVAFGVVFGLNVAQAETLQSVVRRALESHPELGAIRFNRHAIDHELTAARGQQLPTVDVRGEIGQNRDIRRNGFGVRSGDNWHDSRELSTIASQRLFDGFETTHEIARHKNRVESARWRVTDTANSIALRAVQAYLEVQRAGAVLEQARLNVGAHQRLLARVQRRVAGGGGVSSDVSEAIGRTANAQAVLVEAEGRLRDAQAQFFSVAGPAPKALAPVGLPLRAPPPTVESAVASAREAAPSVLATQHDTIAAQAAIGTAYSRYYPRVNLEVGSNHGWGLSEDGDRSTEARAMLVVRWNLFNGGIDKARIWEAKARAMEASEVTENTRRIIERETLVSWNAIITARERVPILRRQVQQATATRAAYNRQYDGGQRRLLDLLNIQAEVFVAESSLRTEQFIHLYNSYRVLAATGQLVHALGLELPAEAITPHAPTLLDGWRDGRTNWSTRVYHHREREVPPDGKAYK